MIRSQGGLTTHSTGLAISRSVRLNLDSSPVNSGVMPHSFWYAGKNLLD